MAVIRWEAWLPDVATRVPGAANPVIEEALRQVAIEFCERTRFLRAELDPMTTIAGETDYDLTADTQSEAQLIESVTLNGFRLDPPGRYYVFNEADQTLSLRDAPDGAYPLLVTVSLRPTQAATGVDAMIYERFRDAIASGAIARISAMPGAWANPALAQYHRAAFEEGVRGASARVARCGTAAPLRAARCSIA